MRLFVAVDMDEGVKKNLEPLLSRLSAIQGLKVVEKENLHITLMFLGEVEESRIEKLKEALTRVKFSPFKIHLKKVGRFPEKGDVRVIWVGIENEDEIRELAEKVYSELKKLGFKRDKDFVAHVTVARVKKRNKEIDSVIREFEDKDFGEMLVKDFRLKQSILKPTGPIYKDVHVFPGN
ncbi:MAG: RNA 2',3'-cyclic phosphodiesterase [Archaeoglobaceae archaeon]